MIRQIDLQSFESCRSKLRSCLPETMDGSKNNDIISHLVTHKISHSVLFKRVSENTMSVRESSSEVQALSLKAQSIPFSSLTSSAFLALKPV